MNRTNLAREAVIAAARLRTDQKIGPTAGLCPFDLALNLDLSVHFADVPSLEGMYSPTPTAAVILGADRSLGRRRYTCGHEIGHHVFGHGFKLDELGEGNSAASSPEEFLAQRFSGALLMPKLAITLAFSRRGWTPSKLTTEQVFIIAQEFGVGFTALLTHLEFNLNLISSTQSAALRPNSLGSVRSSIAGFSIEKDLFVVDSDWCRPSVDVEIGDVVTFSSPVKIDGKIVSPYKKSLDYFAATAQGKCELTFEKSKRTLSLRVSKRNFVGRAMYRHLAESEDDE